MDYERAAETVLKRDNEESVAQYNIRKGMALLLRKTEGKTEEEQESNRIMKKIKDYVQALEIGAIDVRN